MFDKKTLFKFVKFGWTLECKTGARLRSRNVFRGLAQSLKKAQTCQTEEVCIWLKELESLACNKLQVFLSWHYLKFLHVAAATTIWLIFMIQIQGPNIIMAIPVSSIMKKATVRRQLHCIGDYNALLFFRHFSVLNNKKGYSTPPTLLYWRLKCSTLYSSILNNEEGYSTPPTSLYWRLQ